MQFFNTSEKKDHLVANRRRWLEHRRHRAAMQERWPHEWHDIEYQGAVARRRRVMNSQLGKVGCAVERLGPRLRVLLFVFVL